MSCVSSSVAVELNSTGFGGADVDALLPDFITERKTNVGLTWHNSVNGPESFGVFLAVGAILGAVGSGFMQEFGADLYRWAKEKLLNVLNRKRHPDCYISIQFEDVVLFFHEDGLFSDPMAGAVILDFFEQLPRLVLQVDPSKSKVWEASRNRSGGSWDVSPHSD